MSSGSGPDGPYPTGSLRVRWQAFSLSLACLIVSSWVQSEPNEVKKASLDCTREFIGLALLAECTPLSIDVSKVLPTFAVLLDRHASDQRA
jgi:hypothetical protein